MIKRNELYIADTLSRAYIKTNEDINEDEYEVMEMDSVSDNRLDQIRKPLPRISTVDENHSQWMAESQKQCTQRS
jgi:hypothetical protein